MSVLGLLERSFWGNSLGRWALALGIALAVVFVLRVAARVVLSRIRAIAGRTATDADDLMVELLSRTKLLFILVVAVWAGSLALSLSPAAEDRIRAVLALGLFLQAAFWGTGIVNHLVEKYRRRQLEVDPADATAVGAMGFVARVLVWSVFLLLALDNLGLDVTALIAGLGVGGIAVALAVQNVLGDLFASLSIVLDKPFVLGDFVVVGEFAGTVENVGLKTTRIRSLSGEQLVFSNSDLLNSRIRNFKRMRERRIVFEFGVLYSTPPETVRRIPDIVREAVETMDNTRFDRSHFKSFGASALEFESVYFMLVPDYNAYMDTQQAINLELFRRFGEEGIEFAFPTRTVHLHQEDGGRREPGRRDGREEATEVDHPPSERAGAGRTGEAPAQE